MFDFSFGELMVTAAVALVVIGPEKLPKVARTVGALLGRAQRYVHNLKQDLQQDMQMDEWRKANPLDDLQQLKNELNNELHSERQKDLPDVQSDVQGPPTQLTNHDPSAKPKP